MTRVRLRDELERVADDAETLLETLNPKEKGMRKKSVEANTVAIASELGDEFSRAELDGAIRSQLGDRKNVEPHSNCSRVACGPTPLSRHRPSTVDLIGGDTIPGDQTQSSPLLRLLYWGLLNNGLVTSSLSQSDPYFKDLCSDWLI